MEGGEKRLGPPGVCCFASSCFRFAAASYGVSPLFFSFRGGEDASLKQLPNLRSLISTVLFEGSLFKK